MNIGRGHGFTQGDYPNTRGKPTCPKSKTSRMMNRSMGGAIGLIRSATHTPEENASMSLNKNEQNDQYW